MDGLIEKALRAADLPAGQSRVEPLGSQAVNATYRVHLVDGRTCVVRAYRWPFDRSDDLDRSTKEVWLLDLLRRHGVPAPRVVGRLESADADALVLTDLPGCPLGDLANRPADAWEDVGRTLARIHDICVSDEVGVIAGSSLRPFAEGSWADWQRANALSHARSLAVSGRYSIDVGRIDDLFAQAHHLVDERPVRLLHNDPHVWNVLVNEVAGSWRCTGWLDWEFAWSGDPAWDVTRLDVFRLKDIGPTPAAFYEGYGAGRVPVVSDLYELAILMWMANEAATGDMRLLPTYGRADRYLKDLPAQLDRLERTLSSPDQGPAGSQP